MRVRFLCIIAFLLSLTACVTPVPDRYNDPALTVQLRQLIQATPTDALLLGEQHDAPDHQRIHLRVIAHLISQQRLAALALEMAEAGQSTTRLDPQASETQVRAALQWNNLAWPWSAYGPAVMEAVRAGIPVIGANLPGDRLRPAMGEPRFDRLLPASALKIQQQNIRQGHCDLLPESQIGPMTRIQIARDESMAQTLMLAAQPGKTVVLLAGSGHVDRNLGIPRYLAPDFKVQTIFLQTQQTPQSTAQFDQVWPATPAPVVDYCARFRVQQKQPAAADPP
jgi:uncharacterized iron-regulated protein